MYRINYSTIPDDIIWNSFRIYKKHNNYIARFATELDPNADLWFYEDGDIARFNNYSNCTTSYDTKERLITAIQKVIKQIKEESPVFIENIKLKL